MTDIKTAINNLLVLNISNIEATSPLRSACSTRGVLCQSAWQLISTTSAGDSMIARRALLVLGWLNACQQTIDAVFNLPIPKHMVHVLKQHPAGEQQGGVP